jgi:uncharacterized protein YoxC
MNHCRKSLNFTNMKICLILFFSLMCLDAFSQIIEVDSTITIVTSEHQKLRAEIKELKEEITRHYEELDRIIAFSGYAIAGLGLSMVFVGIGLALWVSNIWKKIEAAKSEQDKFTKQAEESREKTEKIFYQIQHNARKLYEDIKREETVNTLERLIEVPEDISNIGHILLSRNLELADFNLLKNAFRKAQSTSYYIPTEEMDIYRNLFFQHFSYKSLLDREINEDLIPNLHRVLKNSFPNEIINSTDQFVSAILDKGIKKSSEEINALVQGVGDIHNINPEIFLTIVRSLKSKENFATFYKLIKDDHRSFVGSR